MKDFNKEIRATSGWWVFDVWLRKKNYKRTKDNEQAFNIPMIDLPFEFMEGVYRRFILEKGAIEISSLSEVNNKNYAGNAYINHEWIETEPFKTDQEAMQSIIIECFKRIK